MSTALSRRRAQLAAFGRQVLPVAMAALVIFTARAVLADHYTVPTGSMEPTVKPGDRVLVDKRAYGLRIPLTETWVYEGAAPAPGDVVILASPTDGTTLLKRVVGVPGEVVEVRGGRLLRDGRESPIHPGPDTPIERLNGTEHAVSFASGGGPNWGPARIPEGRFLVMGDNRGNSFDGRMFGLVEREAILGRAMGVYYRDGFLWQEL